MYDIGLDARRQEQTGPAGQRGNQELGPGLRMGQRTEKIIIRKNPPKFY